MYPSLVCIEMTKAVSKRLSNLSNLICRCLESASICMDLYRNEFLLKRPDSERKENGFSWHTPRMNIKNEHFGWLQNLEICCAWATLDGSPNLQVWYMLGHVSYRFYSLTLYTLVSVCIFSIVFSKHFLSCCFIIKSLFIWCAFALFS